LPTVTHNSYVRAESRLVAVVGLSDVVVVETPDAVLVMHKVQGARHQTSYCSLCPAPAQRTGGNTAACTAPGAGTRA